MMQAADNDTGIMDKQELKKLLGAKMGEKDSHKEMNRAFCLFDVDAKGLITLRDLKRVVQELGEEVTDAELGLMIRCADRNQNRGVSLSDFQAIIKWAAPSSKPKGTPPPPNNK
eukprot:TRINITY_DN4674_c0_g1_i2.p1 TRINITY_DN4674_c0_g1~~TRINITY_DN4674_c0_g1_i2.p1  ORF type:complete len:114 (+),score=25.72 TRINITY_DN4674_c0_g1_i2:113-454(+)